MRIIVASHNQGKINEFKRMLEPLGYEVLGSQDLGLDVSKVVEDGDSFEENALIKAKFVYDTLKIPALSDDSGLILNAFPELLGLHSARFLEGQPYSAKHRVLLEHYRDVKDRSAYFKTALVYYDGSAKYFTGSIQGLIAHESKGSQGFGYDPIFIPEGRNESFAEMDALEKAKISHRSIAVGKFVNYLKEEKV